MLASHGVESQSLHESQSLDLFDSFFLPVFVFYMR